VLDKAVIDRPDLGALRMRLVAVKDTSAAGFPFITNEQYHPSVLLDLDYWVLVPV
jgi:2-methylfumaryl-CoA hydratase